MKLNWTNILCFSFYSWFLVISGKVASSYEGCVMISNGLYLPRILYSVMFSLLAFIFIAIINKDISKIFMIQEKEK